MKEIFKQIRDIENAHFFRSLEKKTQVVSPLHNKGLKNYKNRLTHSYEVSSAAEQILMNLNISDEQKILYSYRVRGASLLHDSGHPPFGHEGAKLLNKIFKSKGLKEGFSDNNNNLVVIEKSGIKIAFYLKASIIKYPNKIYDYQKDFYLKILESSINEDIVNFPQFKVLEKPTRTFACEVMDIADENSYLTSDLADAIVAKIIKKNVILKELDLIISQLNNKKLLRQIYSLKISIKTDDKSSVRFSLLGIQELLNDNYYVSDNLKLISIDEELEEFKKVLYRINKKLFIHSPALKINRIKELDMFNEFISFVLQNEIFLSKTYKKRYFKSNNEDDKLRVLRDMIAERDDIYIMEKLEEFKKGLKND